jgi:uncharacterized membrane protein required for colicin V production
MEHWLSITAAVFLVCMVLYGHYRGFLQIAVSMSALVISVLFVRAVTPQMTHFLKENTQLQYKVQQTMIRAVGGSELLELPEETTEVSTYQRIMIEQLKIPQQMKEVLLENNNSEIYKRLGVNTFIEYLGVYLADMILNLAASIILFIIVYLGLRLLVHALNLVARLPILNGMNQIAGAGIGLIRGLLWIWAVCLLINICSGMAWSVPLQEQIQGSVWLSFLYDNNLYNYVFAGIIRCLL